MGGANLNPQMASVKKRAILRWQRRGLRTTVRELILERLLALLISESCKWIHGEGQRRITCGSRNHLERSSFSN